MQFMHEKHHGPHRHIGAAHEATVVGPKGEEIYCDEWGRVKVSFPWDRESQNNEFSSCWGGYPKARPVTAGA
ncbi:hypothetical protein PPUN12996_19490 [Pseudomonas putida]|nr:hypothetical protein PPUN12996_19490 [Pseudomonas putida]